MDNDFFTYSAIFSTGICLGFSVYWLLQKIKLKNFHNLAQEILLRAELDADSTKKNAVLAAKQDIFELKQQHEIAKQADRKELLKEEERLKLREDKLENRMNLVEKKLSDIEKREALIQARKKQLDEEKQQIQDIHQAYIHKLEEVSLLTSMEAKNILLEDISQELKNETTAMIRKAKKEAEEEAEREATRIMATAISRLAVSCASEATVTTVAIPTEEMKGRIIGREGRNIKTLERATGVNFVIDETPGAIVISGFDPIRKYVAKLALSELILDGRIHPTRIEEAVEKSMRNVQKQIRQHGEDAAFRCGVMNLHPELITLLGKLKFRFSLGQNVLDHSIEVAHLMGIMASELGLDVRLAKRIGLLHDMGKSLTHEIEGSHAVIGHDFALKYGESKEVANGIGCHHQEMPPITIEGSLCSAADALSASRPGARVEAIEEYIRRLKRLEDLAYEFKGVEKAFAMQAGREVRVIVTPEIVDDDALLCLARNLTKKIESDLEYPSKIKVTVIREKRAIEYAV